MVKSTVTTIVVTLDASTWTARVGDDGVAFTDASAPVSIDEQKDGRFRITGPFGTVVASAVKAGDVIWVGIEGHVLELRAGSGAARRPATRDTDSLAPLMSANVVRIHVRPGDAVQEGDALVTLEAMKMEMSIRAPRAGTVAAIHCTEGALAPAGTAVVTLE